MSLLIKATSSNFLMPSSTDPKRSGQSKSLGARIKNAFAGSEKSKNNAPRSAPEPGTRCETEVLIGDEDLKKTVNEFAAFTRYNQLVTTRISPQGLYASEEFSTKCSILSKKHGIRFIHGMPEDMFDMALLWCPAEPLTRRDSREPSWSWTGWKGAVNFPFDPTSCPDMPKDDYWLRSEIIHYHIGPKDNTYEIRRSRDESLHIQYLNHRLAHKGNNPSQETNTLRFEAFTVPFGGFHFDQLHHKGKEVPCSMLLKKDVGYCGFIMDFKGSISARCDDETQLELVLISRNLRVRPNSHARHPRNPTIHPAGTPIWDGNTFVWMEEMSECDNNFGIKNEDIFTKHKWKMLNAILAKKDQRGNYERVAVARIHDHALGSLKKGKDKIILR